MHRSYFHFKFLIAISEICIVCAFGSFSLLQAAPIAGAKAAAAPKVSNPEPPAANANDEAAVRKALLGFLGAFANDGFKARDGFWAGQLQKGKSKLLRVHLYAPNAYWFCAAASPETQIAISVYDETGAPVKTKSWSNGSLAAGGFLPSVNGVYLIRLTEKAGKPADFCFTYSYK